MDQPYHFLADCLSKFHMASEPIQALWILALAGTTLGVTGMVVRGAVGIAKIRNRLENRPSPSFDGASRLIQTSPVMRGLDPHTHALNPRAEESRG